MLKFPDLPVPEPDGNGTSGGGLPLGPALVGILLPLALVQLPLPFPEGTPPTLRIFFSSLLALTALLLTLRLSGIAHFKMREPVPGETALFSWLWKYLLGLEAGTVILHVFSVLMLELLKISFDKEQELVTLLKTLDAPGFSLLAAALVLMIPFYEEVIFRYLLYGLCLRCGSVKAAVLLQAVIFAALHFHPAVFLPLFFFGILQETAYLKSRRFVVPVMLHALFNLLTVINAFFS